MALATVESSEETRVLPYLEDAEAEFISLVDHAANREPFRIIKKEKDKTEQNLVVASLIIPKEQTVETLKSEKGLEWLPDLNAENAQTFEAWTQFPVTEVKKLDPASFTIKELGTTGAYAVVGQLKPSSKQDDDLVTFPDAEASTVPLTPDANELPIATELIPVTYSFSDLFYKELDGFVGVVQGTLSQSAMDPKRRKAAVMSALQAFGSFLSMAVDAVGAQAAKMEKPADTLTLADVIKHFDQVTATQKNDTELGGTDMFESKDEMKAFITDTVKEVMKAEKEQEAAQAQEVQVEKTETTDNTEQLTKAVSDLSDTVQKLQDELKTVAEKQDNFEHTVLGSPSSPEDIAQKNDKPTSKWSGIFV